MLWHHKASLYSFHLLPYNNAVVPQSLIVFIIGFPSNNVVTPQSFIVLILFLLIHNAVAPQSFIVLIQAISNLFFTKKMFLFIKIIKQGRIMS